MCIGNMYQSETYVYGTGLIKVHEMEKSHKVPMILISQDIVKILHNENTYPDDFNNPLKYTIPISESEDGTFVDYLKIYLWSVVKKAHDSGNKDDIFTPMILHKIAIECLLISKCKEVCQRKKEDVKFLNEINKKVG